jgi:hypothetical protein
MEAAEAIGHWPTRVYLSSSNWPILELPFAQLHAPFPAKPVPVMEVGAAVAVSAGHPVPPDLLAEMFRVELLTLLAVQKYARVRYEA